MKRFWNVLLCALMTVSLSACGSSSAAQATEAAGKYTPGTYTGTAAGRNGDVTVEVTLSSDKIEKVEVTDHKETEGIGTNAVDAIPGEIVDAQSLDVDAVAGATVTSDAIIEAVKAAMESAGVDVSTLAASTAAAESAAPEAVDTDYDIVVVGAGGAGLCAAVTAEENGASVVVLEKEGVVGGNTLVSGGEIAAPGNDIQKAQGIEDSADQFYDDVMKGGDNVADPALVRVLADNALDAATWLKDDVGEEFEEDNLFKFGGHSVARSLVPVGQNGVEMITKLSRKAEDLGVVVLTNCDAKELVQDDSGKVVGVKADYNGQDVTFNAAKAVILTTGGFGSNIEMRKQYNPEMDEKILSTCTSGSTGDGIVMGQAVGAAVRDMEYIQTYPTCDITSGLLLYVGDVRLDGRALLVNKEGDRFVGELDRRDVISKAVTEQTGSVSYMVWEQSMMDQTKMDQIHADEYKKLLDDGHIVKADTLKEAADFFGIDADELQKTIDQWNADCAAGKDSLYDGTGPDLIPIEEGPYYIMVSQPSVHHTMGGLVINTNAEVQNENGETIPGLYAAGEVTGGIHGTNRLGSDAICDITVFGRIAGANAAKN
ncbi:MAG: flavocytochrome c [Bulleidia sp.]|nr:flavocytochrome c [Bulleidia sp.]